MELERMRELAFRYVHEALEPGEKPPVFGLIMHNEAFRRCLKEELELKARLQEKRTAMPPDLKAKLLAGIQAEAVGKGGQSDAEGDPAWLLWSEWALGLAAPPIVYPIIKTLQRRCLA